MAVESWLARTAAVHPDRVALEDDEGAVRYAELWGRARSAAEELAGRIEVAIPTAPVRPFVEALHGCLAAGVAAVPVDARLGAEDGAAIVADRAVARPASEAAGDPVAVVVHTSGTTADPRPIGLTHGNWEASAHASRAALGLEDEERWLCALPLAHVGGLSILTRCAIFGWTAIVHPGFDAGRVTAALMAGEATVVSLVPTMLARLLDAGLERPPTLRCALVGGGPLDGGLAERARAAGVPVAQTYGLTEACSQVTTQRSGDADATAGQPLPGTEVRIADDGEIVVAGPTVAPGAAGEDGWLRTGDLGELDVDGRLTVTGRRSETIVTGGENVAPAEVEAALLAHPAVAEAVVHGRPDPEWGEAVVATVVLRTGEAVDDATLRAHCASRLARFKVPKEVRFADSLPRTPSGKVVRRLT